MLKGDGQAGRDCRQIQSLAPVQSRSWNSDGHDFLMLEARNPELMTFFELRAYPGFQIHNLEGKARIAATKKMFTSAISKKKSQPRRIS